MMRCKREKSVEIKTFVELDFCANAEKKIVEKLRQSFEMANKQIQFGESALESLAAVNNFRE